MKISLQIPIEIEPAALANLLGLKAEEPPVLPPRSTVLTDDQARDLLRRVDPTFADIIRKIAINGGVIPWGEARVLLGIQKARDWSGFGRSCLRGTTKALRNLTGQRSAHLFFWDDAEWDTLAAMPDAADGTIPLDRFRLFIDGPALEALRRVTLSAGET